MNEQSNLKRHQHSPMRTHVGNCIIIGGFCTSIRKDICDALHKSFQMGTRSRAKEGEWEGEADGYWNGELIYDVWHCPFCDYRIEEDEQELLPNYCPNCGADMRREKE